MFPPPTTLLESKRNPCAAESAEWQNRVRTLDPLTFPRILMNRAERKVKDASTACILTFAHAKFVPSKWVGIQKAVLAIIAIVVLLIH